MLGRIILRLHTKKSDNKIKNYLSEDDFAYWLANKDGYLKELPKWIWWF